MTPRRTRMPSINILACSDISEREREREREREGGREGGREREREREREIL